MRGWGHQAGPGFLIRYREGLLLPVSELNSGFVQPAYPEQVIDSYLQASLVFDFIESRWGLQVIRDWLRGYRDGKGTPELIESLLRISMDDLDRDFDEYFQQRFAGPLEALEPPVSSPGIPRTRRRSKIGRGWCGRTRTIFRRGWPSGQGCSTRSDRRRPRSSFAQPSDSSRSTGAQTVRTGFSHSYIKKEGKLKRPRRRSRA